MKIETKSLFLGMLLSATIIIGLEELNFVTKANAEVMSKQCVWSYVNDFGFPNMGENGKIELSEVWLKMSKDGWMLKAVNSHGDIYIFEKCN